MSFENFFGAKTSATFFIGFENCWKQRERSHESARNQRANHVGIQLKVYNYKSSNWTPVIWYSRDRAPIKLQIENFVIDTINVLLWHKQTKFIFNLALDNADIVWVSFLWLSLIQKLNNISKAKKCIKNLTSDSSSRLNTLLKIPES